MMYDRVQDVTKWLQVFATQEANNPIHITLRNPRQVTTNAQQCSALGVTEPTQYLFANNEGKTNIINISTLQCLPDNNTTILATVSHNYRNDIFVQLNPTTITSDVISIMPTATAIHLGYPMHTIELNDIPTQNIDDDKNRPPNLPNANAKFNITINAAEEALALTVLSIFLPVYPTTPTPSIGTTLAQIIPNKAYDTNLLAWATSMEWSRNDNNNMLLHIANTYLDHIKINNASWPNITLSDTSFL